MMTQDFIGSDKSEEEYTQFIDYHFLKDGDYTLRVITASGTWACKRDKYNDRGDKSSIMRRAKSIRDVGFLMTHRGGPFVFDSGTTKGMFDVGHWATLLEGAEMVWKENSNHKNLQTLLSSHP